MEQQQLEIDKRMLVNIIIGVARNSEYRARNTNLTTNILPKMENVPFAFRKWNSQMCEIREKILRKRALYTLIEK